MRPGFCGAIKADLSQPAIMTTAANPVAITHRERFLSSIIWMSSSYGLVLQVRAQREVRRLRRGVEFVLDFRLRHPVVRLGIHSGELAPVVNVADAEHQRRSLLGP